MFGKWNTLAALLGIVLRAATIEAAPAQASETKKLHVILTDYAGAPDILVSRAKVQVAFIYRAAGVDLEWLDLDDARLRDDDILRTVITVNLYSEEMTNRAGAEETVVGKAPPGGRTARIFYHRVEQIWNDTGAGGGFLLGNVIAHEIGHLLLPDGAHSLAGLMVAAMNAGNATQRPLFFTPEQSKIVRDRTRIINGALSADDDQ